MTRVDREAHEARRDEPAAVGVVEVGSKEQRRMRSSQAAVDALGELHPVVGCLCGERKRHDRDHGKAGGAAEASLESVHHACTS